MATVTNFPHNNVGQTAAHDASLSEGRLIRSKVWSKQLMDELQAHLMAQQFVSWLGDFADGEEFIIPTINSVKTQIDATTGKLVAVAAEKGGLMDYTEDSPVEYSRLSSNDFRLTITEYLSSGNYITNKMKQDTFYMNELVSQFVPKEARAIAERIESDIFQLTEKATQVFRASSILDMFARARYELQIKNVPLVDLVAIVPPSMSYYMNTSTTLATAVNNPKLEGVLKTGINTGLRYMYDLYGFSVFESNMIPNLKAGTVGGVALKATEKGMMFFSNAADVRPFVGKMRQEPKVDSQYNQDFQREEYVTTCRYGLGLRRPENFVVCPIKADDISIAEKDIAKDLFGK